MRGYRLCRRHSTPHSLFDAPKRERAVDGPREKTPAMRERAGFQANPCPRRGKAGVWRFQTPASSRSAAAAPERQSSSSEKRRPGRPRSPTPAQSTPRAETFLKPDRQSHREALFSFGPCTARFLFGKSEKKMGGAFCAEAARPLIGNQENVTTVPVFPSRASRHLSRLVMMARRPGLARTNFIAAWTLGSMLPTPNCPSAAYRAASARLR